MVGFVVKSRDDSMWYNVVRPTRPCTFKWEGDACVELFTLREARDLKVRRNSRNEEK